jgi:glycosyltransferase involved in cell wall biosynthesis
MPEPINVLYVCATGEMGGVERFIDSVISHHHPEIVRAVVLTFQQGSWLSKLQNKGISTYCIHNGRLRQPLRIVRETSQILKKENIHIVHSAYSWSHALISPAAMMHKCQSVWMHHGPIGKKKWQGFMSLMPASLLLTNSQFMQQQLANTWHLAKKMDVIYYGLDSEEFAPNPTNRNEFRNHYGIEDSQIAIGIVGFLDTWKGQNVFIEAISLLKKLALPIRPFIIGGPRTGLASERCLDFEQKLHKLARLHQIEDALIFTGHIDIKTTGALDGLDIFVHASTEPEPFGMVLLEAMAKAKPIVASAEGGPCEILTHEKDGLLIQPRLPETLAQAIKQLCENPALRTRLGQAARQTVITKFNPKIAASNLENWYVKLFQKIT